MEFILRSFHTIIFRYFRNDIPTVDIIMSKIIAGYEDYKIKYKPRKTKKQLYIYNIIVHSYSHPHTVMAVYTHTLVFPSTHSHGSGSLGI